MELDEKIANRKLHNLAFVWATTIVRAVVACDGGVSGVDLMAAASVTSDPGAVFATRHRARGIIERRFPA